MLLEEKVKKHWQLFLALDWWLVGTMVLLSALSIAFVYSATYRGPDAPQQSYYLLQLSWVAIGWVFFLVTMLLDYRKVVRWAPLLYGIGILSLVFVLAAPNSIVPRVNGAKSWIDLRWFKLQPSEFAKIAYVLFVAYFFVNAARGVSAASTFLKSLLILIPMVGLVVVQPDMGIAATLIPMFIAMAYVAGTKTKYLVWLLVAAIAISPIVWTYGLKEYQRRRLTVFLNPERDVETMMGAGWNLRQSKIAVGSGGLMGEGYLQGGQKMLGYLPRAVVHNDFIFAVFAEERGFVGAVVLIGLYGLLLYRGVRVGLRLREPLAQVMAAGIVAMLFFNIFVNIGMTIGLMPITGLPLPLMSYGGSSMLSTMMALGLLQSAYVRRQLY